MFQLAGVASVCCKLQVAQQCTLEYSVMNTLWLQRCRMAPVLSCRSQYSILNNISSTKQHSLRVQLPSWRVKKAFLYQLMRWNAVFWEVHRSYKSRCREPFSVCRVTALYFRRSNGTVFIFTTCPDNPYFKILHILEKNLLSKRNNNNTVPRVEILTQGHRGATYFCEDHRDLGVHPSGWSLRGEKWNKNKKCDILFMLKTKPASEANRS